MWQILLILTFVLQPLVALPVGCAPFDEDVERTAAMSCCAQMASSEDRHAGCCSGAAICACGDDQTQRLPAPVRSNIDIEQVLAALQRPTGLISIREIAGQRGAIVALSQVAMLPSAAAPHAFFCVWLT